MNVVVEARVVTADTLFDAKIVRSRSSGKENQHPHCVYFLQSSIYFARRLLPFGHIDLYGLLL